MKTYRPTTPSRRKMSTVSYRGVITASEPYKPLTRGFRRGSGRNAYGRITSQHRGGGHKRSFREIDFSYDKLDIPAKVQTVEYDPNRSGFIGLVAYADGAKRYVLLPKSMKVGDKFIVSEKADLVAGNRTALKSIPVGTFVYNIELKPRTSAKLVRSAGVYAQVVAHDEGYTSIKLPSSEVRKVTDTCFASIGEVSNDEYRLRNLGKAGRSRHLGIRPKTRAMAMNPVDHPYGGGEGAQPRGTRRPKTRHGKITGGHKTRTPKKYSNVHIVSRRVVRKKK
ncbi:MAG: Translation protein SH3-like protein [Candidatus Nomurabacteria bacterium]|nr:Translation protein SH3-like protein [Candidatus Nomurabacteria bacterium]